MLAKLPELVGLSADLIDPKAKKKKSQPDEPTAKVVVIGLDLERQLAKGERVTRVCLDTVLEQATQAYARLEREEAEQIIAAFHSWDANGDGELQFDEFREMAAYSNPSLPPKTMMKIYRAATPDGEHINVLKFSQVMLENGLTLKRRPPEDCFDEKGQLKAVRGGNADAAANAMVFKGGGSRAKRGWGRLGAAERGGKSLGRMTLMMNLGQMMSGGMEAGVAQHGQRAPLAGPEVGPRATLGRAWQLWLVRRSHGRDRPTGRPATASGARASRLRSRPFLRR